MSDKSKKDAQVQLTIVEGEKRLLRALSDCYTYDQLMDILHTYVFERWGFDTISMQIVDYKAKKLHLGIVKTTSIDPENIQSLVENDIPLDDSASVSARAALSKEWYYVDYKRSKEVSSFSSIDAEIVNKIGIKENLILPIVHQDVALGVLHFTATEHPPQLSQNDIEEILDLVQLIAPNIKFQQRHQDAIFLRNEQQAHIELVREISTTPGIRGLITLLGREIDLVFNPYGYFVCLMDNEAESLVCEKARFPVEMESLEKSYYGFRFSIEKEHFAHKCISDSEIVTITPDEVLNFKDVFVDRFVLWKISSLLLIPIMSLQGDDRALGMIVLLLKNQAVEPARLEKIQEELLYFIEPLVIARQYSKLKEMESVLIHVQEERQQALSFIKQIYNLTSADVIFSKICNTFLNWFEFDCAAVLMEEDKYLQPKAVVARTPDDDALRDEWETHLKSDPYPIKVNAGAFSNCYLGKVKLYIPEMKNIYSLPMAPRDERWCKGHPHNKSMLHLPITEDGKAIGVFSMLASSRNVKLSEAQIELIELLCSFTAGAIRNAQMYSTIEHQKSDIEQAMGKLQATQDRLLNTEKKRVEALKMARDAAEASAHSKSRFLANMSHEIRTPMNAVIGLTDLALKNDPKPKIADYLKKIDNSAKALLTILNDILDFSKIEAGKLQIESIDFSQEQLLGYVSDIFSDMMANKAIDFVMKVDPEVPDVLIGDPNRVSQVLINLINNAYKFTEKGSIFLDVSLVEKNENQARLGFKVADTGIGIETDKLDALFESFTQEDVSTTRKFGGTGLGLTICKNLVELMDGSITAHSVRGKGSEFSFDVLLGYRQEQADFSVPEDILDNKLLIVESNPDMLQNYRDMLEGYGFQTNGVRSGNECINRLSRAVENSDGYGAVLLDAILPDLNSIETIRRISANPLTESIPIIVLGTHLNQEEFNNNEFKDRVKFVVKPMPDILLVKTVCELLKPGFSCVKVVQGTGYDEDQFAEHLGGAHILVAEDNPINQQVAQELLERVSVVVDIVENGQEALDLLAQNTYQAFLTDLQMPVMDGLECAKTIRNDSAYDDLPIVAMTAHALQEEREECLSLGVNDYITKPIDVRILYTTLCRLIQVQSGEKIVAKQSLVQADQKREANNRLMEKMLAFDQQTHVFDLKKALALSGNNAGLLSKVFQNVVRSYQEIGVNVIQAYSSGDFEHLAATIHPFKGLCGTMGAVGLQQICIDIENGARQSPPCVHHGDMDLFLEQVATLFEQAGEIVALSEEYHRDMASGVEESSESLADIIRQLEKELEQNSFDVEPLIQQLGKKLENTDYSVVVDQIQEAVDAFEYDQALEILKSINLS